MLSIISLITNICVWFTCLLVVLEVKDRFINNSVQTFPEQKLFSI